MLSLARAFSWRFGRFFLNDENKKVTIRETLHVSYEL
jgi:hypothetical protein